MAIALVAAAVTMNRGAYSASFVDASGYLAAAQLLREGRLARAVPLQLIPAVRDSGATTSPVGFRPGIGSGTEVPYYPLGYPMLMAAAMHVGGEQAAYLVAPLALAALIVCVFLLTEMLAGGVAGVLAAVLMAANPIALQNSITAMSDVPAAACWAAAWYFALRGTSGAAAAAGALVALACLIRPNLTAMAVVPGMLILYGGARSAPARWSCTPTAVFGLVAAAGPLATAWSQAVLFGTAFQPGYLGWETFFNRGHVALNVRAYPRLFLDVFGWLPLTGLAMAVLSSAGAARVLVVSGLAFIALNIGLYLPYLPHDHWPFLRFFLPALAALTVLFSATVGLAMNALRQRRLTALAWLLPLAASAIIWQGRSVTTYVLDEWKVHLRVPVMGRYLREVLPKNAVVIAFFHGGSAAYYTGHNVVSLEWMLGPALDEALDELVANLERLGCAPVFVVDEALEEPTLKERFKGSTHAALDWPARAEFITTERIRYFVASDRERHLAGERWATDVLRP